LATLDAYVVSENQLQKFVFYWFLPANPNEFFFFLEETKANNFQIVDISSEINKIDADESFRVYVNATVRSDAKIGETSLIAIAKQIETKGEPMSTLVRRTTTISPRG
jgi:hypothetical protein